MLPNRCCWVAALCHWMAYLVGCPSSAARFRTYSDPNCESYSLRPGLLKGAAIGHADSGKDNQDQALPWWFRGDLINFKQSRSMSPDARVDVMNTHAIENKVDRNTQVDYKDELTYSAWKKRR